LARNRHGAIARQPPAPVVEADIERLSDEQTAEAAAVEEELTFDGASILEQHLGNEPVLRALPHVDHSSLDPPHATRFAVAAQISGVQACIEMEGIPQGSEHRTGPALRTRKAIQCRGDGAQVVVAELSGIRFAHLPQLEPELMELDRLQIQAVDAEGMQVPASRAVPVDELDAELEGSLRVAEEIVLVDLEQTVERPDGRDRRLSHPDGADLVGLDQRHGDPAVLYHARQSRRGHPPRSSAAHDHDFPDRSRAGLWCRCGTHAGPLTAFGRAHRILGSAPPSAARGWSAGYGTQTPPGAVSPRTP